MIGKLTCSFPISHNMLMRTLTFQESFVTVVEMIWVVHLLGYITHRQSCFKLRPASHYNSNSNLSVGFSPLFLIESHFKSEVAKEFMSLGHLQLKEDDEEVGDRHGSFLVPERYYFQHSQRDFCAGKLMNPGCLSTGDVVQRWAHKYLIGHDVAEWHLWIRFDSTQGSIFYCKPCKPQLDFLLLPACKRRYMWFFLGAFGSEFNFCKEESLFLRRLSVAFFCPLVFQHYVIFH